MDQQKREIRQRLWNSLEMQVIRRDLCMVAAAFGIVVLLLGPQNGEPGWVMTGLTFCMLVLPFGGFYLWRIAGIFRDAERYTFHNCVLAVPRGKMFVKTMYFDVVLEDPDGTFVVCTHAIFNPYGVVEPLVEHYVNKTVIIAYNPVTEMVVVMG